MSGGGANIRAVEPSVDFERVYRAVPMFADLEQSELAAILEVSRLFRATEGTVLVRQGESGSGMYVLVNGRAAVTLAQDEVDDTTLAVLDRGDAVGELNLIDDAPHSATVTCIDPSTVFHIDAVAFNELRAKGHPAAFKVLRATAPMICERLRHINERIAAIFADPERSMREIEQLSETRRSA